MYIKNITIISCLLFNAIYSMTPSQEIAQQLREAGLSTNQALSILLETDSPTASSTSSSSARSLSTVLTTDNLIGTSSTGISLPLDNRVINNTINTRVLLSSPTSTPIISSLSNQAINSRLSLIPSPSTADSIPGKKQTDIISLLLNAKKTDETDDTDDTTDVSSARHIKRARIENRTLSNSASSEATDQLSGSLSSKDKILPARILETDKEESVFDKVFNLPDIINLIAHSAIKDAKDLALFAGINKATNIMFKGENLSKYLEELKSNWPKTKDTYLDIIVQKNFISSINRYIHNKQEICNKLTDPEKIKKSSQDLESDISKIGYAAIQYNNMAMVRNLHGRNILFKKKLLKAIELKREDIVLYLLAHDKNFKDTCISLNILVRAVASDNTSMVKKILNLINKLILDRNTLKIILNKTDKKGNNILHLAINNDNLELAKTFLLIKELQIDLKNSDGQTPLHIACDIANNEEIFDLLLTELKKTPSLLKNSIVNDDSFHTPLCFAIKNFNKKIFRTLLVEKLYSLDIPGFSRVLAEAVQRDMELFDELLGLCPVQIKSDMINNCLYVICKHDDFPQFDNTEIENFVEKYNADINSFPILATIIQLHGVKNNRNITEIIAYLINNGALVAKNFDTDSLNYPNAIEVGLKAANYEIIKLLIENIDIKNYINKDKDTVLHLISRNTQINNNFKAIQELIEAGVNPNLKNKYNETALHCFINGKCNNLNIIQLLINNGCNVNAEDSDCDTPLFLAIFAGKVKIANLLINNKAILEQRNKLGQTVLNRIIVQNSINLVSDIEYLVKLSADINTVDLQFATPLHNFILSRFAYNNDKDSNTIGSNKYIIEFLISKGSNVTLRDKNGDTPFHLIINNWYILGEIPDLQKFIELFKPSFNIRNNQGNTPYDLALSLIDKFSTLRKIVEQIRPA